MGIALRFSTMMSKARLERAFLLGVTAIMCGIAAAQDQRPSAQPTTNDKMSYGSVRGRVVMPDGSTVTQSVKLTLRTFRESATVIFTDNQGQFEFPNLVPGNYKLEVEADRQLFEVFTENVQVFRGTPTVVTPTLREKAAPGRSTAKDNVVSVSELDRKVPGPARKEFEKATQAANAHKTEEAIAHLRKAISLYPDYVMAYNDLGTYLLEQGKLEEAATELRKAITLDEKAFNPALNLGIVLVYQKRFTEAADLLAKAQSLAPTSPAVHLYSGLAAARLGRFEVADKELRAAYSLGDSNYAIALFHLGQLYLNRADRTEALRFFERYLAEVPNATNADEVRKMIARLHQ
jgi:tetratricopeptide (TPR) repeat protein